MKKSKRIISNVLVFVLVIGMIFATGCSKKNEASTAGSLVVTVGDNKVYMDEMMYYIYAMEANANQYEQLYQQYYGTSYWDMEVEKGVTVRDQMIPTVTYDKEYKQVPLSDKELTKAKEAMTSALEKAKSGEAFADIAKELTTDSLTITNSTLNFVKDDGNAEAKYQEAALKLKKDALTEGIVETDTAYYVIKMVDDNSTESYDAAVQKAITDAENEAFTKKYDEIKKDYTVTENAEVWGKIVMGKTTLVEATTTPAATTAPETTTTPEATATPEPTK